MFPSVKDRARQLFGETAIPATTPPPPVATGRRGASNNAAATSKPAPEPKTPLKSSRADVKSKKEAPTPVEEPPRAIGAWPSPFEQFKARAAPPVAKPTPSTPSKAAASKASKPTKAASTVSKTDRSSKEKADKSTKPSEKKSRPKSPPTLKAAAPPKKAPEPKIVAKKKTESKPAPEPKKSRPRLQTRISSRSKVQHSSSSSSLDSDSESDSDESDEEEDLREACLREVHKVTALKGKSLAISLRQRSSGGWYAALKDVGADKYLKMWMNRDKTFATQDEALEAYLVFVKKMSNDMKLFGPMSPKPGRTKGFFS